MQIEREIAKYDGDGGCSGGGLSPHTFFMVQFHLLVWVYISLVAPDITVYHIQSVLTEQKCIKHSRVLHFYVGLCFEKRRKQKWVSISKKMFECEMLVMKRTMQCRRNAYLKRGTDKMNGERNVYGARQGEKRVGCVSRVLKLRVTKHYCKNELTKTLQSREVLCMGLLWILTVFTLSTPFSFHSHSDFGSRFSS